jgi:hypothetical protein
VIPLAASHSLDETINNHLMDLKIVHKFINIYVLNCEAIIIQILICQNDGHFVCDFSIH